MYTGLLREMSSWDFNERELDLFPPLWVVSWLSLGCLRSFGEHQMFRLGAKSQIRLSFELQNQAIGSFPLPVAINLLGFLSDDRVEKLCNRYAN